MFWRLKFAISLALVFSIAFAGSSSAQELTVETDKVKVSIAGRSMELETIIVKRVDAAGKSPIAILTHGSPATAHARTTMRAEQMLPQARDLALRGWLAVAFMRRGFGTNTEPFGEGFNCAAPNFQRALMTAADDIDAVREEIARRPDADASRVLGVGTSVGGVAMIAWASRQPPGLVGIVNVSGGTGSSSTGMNCDEPLLIRTIAEMGNPAVAPTVWFYAANDNWFPPATVQRMHQGYVARGGRAVLHAFGPVGNDGHTIWSLFAGRELWIPALDRFLRLNALPTWDAADADALNSRLSDSARPVLARFLGAPTHKALAISQSKGIARFWSGTATMDAAREGAIKECQSAAVEPCRVVMENFNTTIR